jgi:nicotinamidase-related amidase
MKNEALLIIDVQNDFFAYPDEPVYKAENLITHINSLIAYFRKQNRPIIFVRHTAEDLVKDTKPWEVYTKINAKPEDIYLDKTTPDSFYKTNLFEIIKKMGIDSLVIVGLQTDYCIDTTCRSAFGKGVPTILVSDCHSTYNNSFMNADKTIEYHNRIIGRWFAELKTTEEIINYR